MFHPPCGLKPQIVSFTVLFLQNVTQRLLSAMRLDGSDVVLLSCMCTRKCTFGSSGWQLNKRQMGQHHSKKEAILNILLYMGGSRLVFSQYFSEQKQ